MQFILPKLAELLYIYRENKSMLSMIIDNISSFMYSKLLVIILIGAGVYFTIRQASAGASVSQCL